MRKNLARATLHAYNKNADNYLKKFGNFEPYREKIELFSQKYIPKHAKVLDLGCGPGGNARLIRERVPTCSVTGVDVSQKMIALARQLAPKGDFIVEDIRQFMPDRLFDVVIASFCIVHLTDQETAALLSTLSKGMAENGYLYLSFMEGDGEGLERTSFSTEHIYFNYYQTNRIHRLLSQNLFEVQEVLTEDYVEQDGSITQDTFMFAVKVNN
ncbi:class I SAM-dependent methyltransferase [Desulfogranum marinum]|uniref:class I SAM-dependent methyltransferase n=1 Tax=Desulfogranum marinum TaxID=453220 RepID=UPI001964E6A4|nr:class I SAM-dependent methyltransferase [Desulfogranum marinum]MBM9514133.1 class I SAM-dependent methyltransferase [Desulfogranum marinum]